MSNLLEQWNEHIIRGNELSRELENFEKIMHVADIPSSAIAFYDNNGTVFISKVLSPEKMDEIKKTVVTALTEAKSTKEIELEKLMGLIPVMPALPNGAKVLIVGEGRPMPHLLPPDAPEVVIPDPFTPRKPATINPEFAAATKEMFESVKQPKPDLCEVALTEAPQTEAERIENTKENAATTPEDKSLDKYPAKGGKRRLPENMTEETVYKMLMIEKKKPKEIAAYYGLTGTQVSNYIFQHDIRNYGKKLRAARKQPEETERP